MNVLITGASGGIGRAIAIEFAKHKCNIIGCAKTNAKGLAETKKTIEDIGVKCYTSICDITNENAVIDFISSSTKEIGSVDILVNNAGISFIGLIQDMSIDEWNNVINTNLTSVFLMSKHIIPYMINKQKGHIINISSVWGNVGASMEAAYSASKGGLNSFTKALASFFEFIAKDFLTHGETSKRINIPTCWMRRFLWKIA